MKNRIALDSMIFIYYLEQAERYFHEVREILLSAQEGKCELVTSIVSVTEVLSAPKYIHLPEIVKEINYFFTEAEFLKVIGLDWDIATEAARLRRENAFLRTPDAIQLATAIISGADLFITNDRKLQKVKVGSMKIRILGVAERM